LKSPKFSLNKKNCKFSIKNGSIRLFGDSWIQPQVPSKDGTMIPISLVYRKSLKKIGGNPLLLYGYGSYGLGVEAKFILPIISLLDRGFIYAIAHVRGGDDLGYQWYEDGKLLKKKHTFEDFIACSESLIEKGYTVKKGIAISGRSAGGILMGYCANERPDLYRAVIAGVPFVDVLNTMLDGDLPLTPGEYKEWGNPKEKQFYHYIKSYSPYENVKAQEYPHMYISTLAILELPER
jgi:oligopeptidase B